MKVSELIEQLQQAQREYGDIPVLVSCEMDGDEHPNYTIEREIISVFGSSDGTIQIADWK